jgi:hypothetical protein
MIVLFFVEGPFLFCWSFFKHLYGKLGWRFVGRNDICFNLKIEDNMFKAISSKRKEEVLETNHFK